MLALVQPIRKFLDAEEVTGPILARFGKSTRIINQCGCDKCGHKGRCEPELTQFNPYWIYSTECVRQRFINPCRFIR